jgi:MATE family multidrug resistance protein
MNRNELPDHIGIREVFRLAWPILLSMLSYTMMGVADTLFVSRLGNASLAALGVAIPLTFLVLSFGLGLFGGLRVAVSQHTGAGRHDQVRRLAWQGLWLAGVLGGLLALLWPAGEILIRWMGAPDSAAGPASEYFAVRVLGTPAMFASIALKSWFEGRGDTRTPMVANVSANLLNVVLDPILIFGLGPMPVMGVRGAALATVLSMLFSALFLAWRCAEVLRSTPLAPDGALLGEVWRFGIPMGLRMALDVGAWVVFTAMLARLGEAQMAAHVIVIRIVSVSFLPGHAVGEATGVLVGQCVGAGRPDDARRSWRSGMLLALAIMGSGALVFLAFPGLLLSAFRPSPEVLALGRSLLLVAVGFQLLDAVAMVGQGALNGAGDTRFVMFTSVSAAWGVTVPLAYLLAFPLDLGVVGGWVGITAELLALAAVSVIRLRGSRWLKQGLEPRLDEAEVEARGLASALQEGA